MREEKRKNAMKLMDESRRKTRGVKFDSIGLTLGIFFVIGKILIKDIVSSEKPHK